MRDGRALRGWRRTSASEQVDVTPLSPWWGEHRSRYLFAGQVLGPQTTVLDVACGTGYGGRLLLELGMARVLGMDMDRSALDVAAQRRAATQTLLLADAVRMPLADGAVPAAVSMETLEHIEDRERFVAELARVLRPGGLLVLSTPNARVSRPVEGVPRNPFHLHEYDPEALRELLQASFSDVRLYGQRVKDAYPVFPLAAPLPEDARPSAKARTALWRVQHRALPFGVKDFVSRLLHNRAFYPSEFDFAFEAEDFARAHVTVAVCRR